MVIHCKTKLNNYVIKGHIMDFMEEGDVIVRFEDHDYNDAATGTRVVAYNALLKCLVKKELS